MLTSSQECPLPGEMRRLNRVVVLLCNRIVSERWKEEVHRVIIVGYKRWSRRVCRVVVVVREQQETKSHCRVLVRDQLAGTSFVPVVEEGGGVICQSAISVLYYQLL